MAHRARYWCFTINNWVQADKDAVRKWFDDGDAKFVIAGEEVGLAGTPHLQGYVQWATQLRLTQCKIHHGTAHWTECRGSPQSNIVYCSKEGHVFIEEGEVGTQGRRGDLQIGFEAYLGGEPLHQAFGAANLLRYGARARLEASAIADRAVPDWRDVTVRVFTGPTDSGKSREAAALGADCEGGWHFQHFVRPEWWPGYEHQKFVVFDDFDPRAVSRMRLLNLLDGYPLHLPIKGGFVKAAYTDVIITSNYVPEEWYQDVPELYIAALQRRISQVKLFDK